MPRNIYMRHCGNFYFKHNLQLHSELQKDLLSGMKLGLEQKAFRLDLIHMK